MVKLNLANIGKLGGKVSVPNYERASLSPGIVHIGVGNFHRAHLAVYLDALFNMGLNKDWAIIGAGVMPSDEAMRQKLAAQDYLTTVVEQEANISTARVTGGSGWPGARRSTMVAIKLMAPMSDAMQKSAMLRTHMSMPAPRPGPATAPTALSGG